MSYFSNFFLSFSSFKALTILFTSKTRTAIKAIESIVTSLEDVKSSRIEFKVNKWGISRLFMVNSKFTCNKYKKNINITE